VEAPGRRGTVPAHIRITQKSSYHWRIYVEKPMQLYADVSYSFQGQEGKGTLSVHSQAGSLQAAFKPTGMFVGEPNSDWQIESFNAHRLGQLEFKEAGYHDIILEVKPLEGEELDFQWLWLGAD